MAIDSSWHKSYTWIDRLGSWQQAKNMAEVDTGIEYSLSTGMAVLRP